jgi:hypothetical protein
VINSAEVIGKQLVGKKAEFAGSDDLKRQTRKFGLVSKVGDIDTSGFKASLARYKGTISSEATYPAGGGSFGDATIAAPYAPTIVTKMKAAGVTTVVLATDAAMNKELMEQASKQEWFPEWFHTGNSYADFATFLQTYPSEQAAHFFGISGISPYLKPQPDPEAATLGPVGDPLAWFWGPMQGTQTARLGNGIGWLLAGIHAAGPDLTPKTFQQGQFSIPATGGSASNSPFGTLQGYGKTAGLPYLEYNRAPVDYVPMWVAVNVEAPSPIGIVGKPSSEFPNNAQRYKAGTWPTTKIPWYSLSKSVASFDTLPANLPAPVRTKCDGCPSTGQSSLTPGTPSQDGFVVKVPSSSSSVR